MPQGLVTRQFMQDIADAIRMKTDEAGSGGGISLITKEITENGTYRASDDNALGYSHVVVDVEGSVTIPSANGVSF